MVKYRLRLKGGETIDKQDKEKYGIFIYGTKGEYLAYYNDEYSFCECGSACYNDDESKFDQNDIDIIPNGLFKKLDVTEVEEQLYYIKFPYVNGKYSYLNLRLDDGNIMMSSTYPSEGCKIKFTKEEIEEKYPLYANDTCMVKVEDVE